MFINKKHLSPNYNKRPSGCIVDTIVIHDTRMSNSDSAIERLCSKESGVSSHYLIARNGEIFNLVPEAKRAWHAGESYWRGREGANDFSIGIELDNIGDEEFPEIQTDSLVWLCKDIMTRHIIKPINIVSHSDISPWRKVDPNSKLNWLKLSREGVGIYSQSGMNENTVLFKPEYASAEILSLKKKLSRFGYRIITNDMKFDTELFKVIHAFKRRYVPEAYHTALWDSISELRLNELLTKI